MKNHLGERVFQTYPAWRRAVREICPILSIGGNKDIATIPGVGEWDGETGVIYNQEQSIQERDQAIRESKKFFEENAPTNSIIRDLKIALADARRCLDLACSTAEGKLPERSYEDILAEIEEEFPS